MLLSDIGKAAELALKYTKAEQELNDFIVSRPRFTTLSVVARVDGQREDPHNYSIPDAAKTLVLDRVENALISKVNTLKGKIRELGVVLP